MELKITDLTDLETDHYYLISLFCNLFCLEYVLWRLETCLSLAMEQVGSSEPSAEWSDEGRDSGQRPAAAWRQEHSAHPSFYQETHTLLVEQHCSTAS